MQQAMEISEKRGVTMVSPEFGQRVELNEPLKLKPWWNL